MARKRPKEQPVDPVWAIREGSEILKPLLEKHGFRFTLLDSGPSSGGRYAAGEFRHSDRRMEFHFRHSLGLVRYTVGQVSLGHERYLRGLGVWGRHHYPGFTEDPLEPFRQLRDDLQEFGSAFLAGSDEFLRLAARIPDER